VTDTVTLYAFLWVIGPKIYDWHLKLIAIDGGFIETKDPFLFLAPEGGYADRFEIIRKKDEPNWTRRVLNKKLYFKGF